MFSVVWLFLGRSFFPSSFAWPNIWPDRPLLARQTIDSCFPIFATSHGGWSWRRFWLCATAKITTAAQSPCSNQKRPSSSHYTVRCDCCKKNAQRVKKSNRSKRKKRRDSEYLCTLGCAVFDNTTKYHTLLQGGFFPPLPRRWCK